MPGGKRTASNSNQCINTVGNEGGGGVDGYSGASPDHSMRDGVVRDEMERGNGAKGAKRERGNRRRVESRQITLLRSRGVPETDSYTGLSFASSARASRIRGTGLKARSQYRELSNKCIYLERHRRGNVSPAVSRFPFDPPYFF